MRKSTGSVFRCITAGVLSLLLAACATASADTALIRTEIARAHRAWWSAYTLGNVGALEGTTAPDAIATFSSGRTLTRSALMQEASRNGTAPGFAMEWSDESIQVPRDDIALVIGTSTESVGPSLQQFRISTILRHTSLGAWEVLAVQSTRIARSAASVPETVSGTLVQLVGSYRTPKGRLLKIEVQAGALRLVEPDGKEIELVAIGPSLFESAGQSPINGVLRFAFSRDEAGRVTAFSRLTEGRVDTYPRAK